MYLDSQGVVGRLTENHTVDSTVTLTATGETITVTGGSVVADVRRDVRRTCDLSLLDVDGVLQARVTPYGVEASVVQTLGWDDGTTWSVPLGVFLLSEPVFDQDSNGVSVRVSGEDRSRRVSRAGRTVPVPLTKATTLPEAIDALLFATYPQITTTATNGAAPALGSTLNYLEGPDMDSWKDAVELANGFGYDLYFDVLGNPVLAPYPGIERLANPDAQYLPGPITKASKAGGDADTYSGVIVVGMSSTGAPVRAEVYDENPNSPTYIYGPFGKVVKWVEIQTPVSLDQCLATARGVLAQVTGASMGLTWEQIPNPGHEPWDVVNVSIEDIGVARSNVLVDSVTIPLGLGTSTVRARDGRWLL